MVDLDTTYCRNCPKCNRIISYKDAKKLSIAIKSGNTCRECSRRKEIIEPGSITELGGLYYRICPKCGESTSNKSRNGAIFAHNHGHVCKQCAGDALKGRKITWGHKMSGRPPKYIVSDPNTGITAHGKSEFARIVGVNIDTVKNRIKKGIYTITEI